MLRYRSLDLAARNVGLSRLRGRPMPPHGACCLSTTSAAFASPSKKKPASIRRFIRNKSKAARSAAVEKAPKAPRAGSKATTTTESTDDPSLYDNESSVMTEAEYEQSLWEAQQEHFPPQHDQQVGSANGSQATPARSRKALWASLKEKLGEQSRNADTGPSESSPQVPQDASASHAPKTPPTQHSKAPRSRRMRTPLDVKKILPRNIEFHPVEEHDQEVPALSYGLERVLFNPGVYQIQDARSQVFNFDPYLTSIMPVDEFDFDALKAYITSSKDTKLREMAKKYGMKYCGSTSSMTAMLSHFHYLLSAWRKPNFSMISRSLTPESENFTRLTRSPAAAYARLNDGVYAIDADKEYDKENVLSMLGKSMEKLLTLPREEFEKYRRTRSHMIPEEERNADEAFHYTTLGDFLMRSQLDARDPRLPGSGVFDLKTRAVVSIRMDVDDPEGGRGYEIKHRIGQWESFEREYYDMIRAAFLKYSLQVRMGRMDGIFLAYHNTQRIFGFQYVSLDEMDEAIHGADSRRLGDQEFKTSVTLLNDLMDRASKRFPGRSLRIHVETRNNRVPVTYFFAEPVTDEDMASSNEAAKRSVDKVQQDIMNMRAKEDEAKNQAEENDEMEREGERSTEDVDTPPESAISEAGSEGEAWEEMMSKVEEFIEDDSQGVANVKDVLQDALEQADLLRHRNEESEKALEDLVKALLVEKAGLKETHEAGDVSPHHISGGSNESLHTTNEAGAEQPTEMGGTSVDSDEKVADQKSGTSSASQHEALKDLFIKLAKSVGDGRPEMGPFERAVAKLADQARSDYGNAGGIEAEAAMAEDQPPIASEQLPVTEGEAELGTPINEQGTTTQDDRDDKNIADVEQSATVKDEELPCHSEQAPVADAEEGLGTPVDEQDTAAQDDSFDDSMAREKLATSEAQELPEVEDDAPTSNIAEEELLTESRSSRAIENARRRETFKAKGELMGMYVTVRNKVNGKFVERPEETGTGKFDWTVEYSIMEMSDKEAHKIYPMLRHRRYNALNGDVSDRKKDFMDGYRQRLKGMAKAGEKYRRRVERSQEGKNVYVAWDEKPLPPETRTEGVKSGD